MSITMTIEVSPEQAVKIAEILAAITVPASAPIPVQQPAFTQTSAPVPVQPAAPTVPVQTAPLAPAPAPIPVQQPAAPAPVPTAVKQYTPDELSIASRPIVEAGRQQELLDLLHSFTYTDINGVVRNVQSIRDMPKELYPAFANGIRQLGGKI